MIGIRINRFRIFATKAYLISDKSFLVVMTSLALHSFLRFKPRDSYTPKGYVDEIQRYGS